jgi:hypothetical protein
MATPEMTPQEIMRDLMQIKLPTDRADRFMPVDAYA